MSIKTLCYIKQYLLTLFLCMLYSHFLIAVYIYLDNILLFNIFILFLLLNIFLRLNFSNYVSYSNRSAFYFD